MKIFIDCEFNDFQGELISMALVSEDGKEFYEWLGCDSPSPWVAENVIPKIGSIKPICIKQFQAKLQQYLNQFDQCHIIADWPEDITHFCKALITGPGWRVDTPPLTFEIIRIDAVSKNPHNALADATALRLVYPGPQDQWINCNDQIPALRTRVLVSNPGGSVMCAVLHKNSLEPTRAPELYWRVSELSDRVYKFGVFTYWKPLPAPPPKDLP